MSRFYVPRKNIGEKEIFVFGDEAHHILDVMRIGEGDKVTVFDGTGAEYTGYVKSSDRRRREAVVEIVSKKEPRKEDRPDIVLAQAIPRKGKMDNIIEKATELGVSRVIPVISDRTIVRPAEGPAARKLERWKKIAVAASKQCGRADVPVIEAITGYRHLPGIMDSFDLCLYACLQDDTIPLREALDGSRAGKVLVIVGPEGDFTPDEIAKAVMPNCHFVSLGSRVLKSDTAGLYMLSVLNYVFS